MSRAGDAVAVDKINKHRSVYSTKAGAGYLQAHSFNDSSLAHAQRDFSALRCRLERDGYLFIKALIPQETVSKAHQYLGTQLQQALPSAVTFIDGHLTATSQQGWSEVGLLQRQDMAHHPYVLQALESPNLAELAAKLLQVPQVKTTKFKWLRAVALGHFTGLHTDRVFLGENSDKLLTMWLPLHSIGPEHGAMLVCSGSHRSRSFGQLRRSYGASQVGNDGTRSGWLTDDGSKLPDILEAASSNKLGIDWRTGGFKAGDVLVLHQDVLHMTASNESGCFRISCDTRWQPTGHPANPSLGSWREIAYPT